MSASAATGRLGVTGGTGKTIDDRHPGPARPAALEPVALARDRRPRDHLDPRRARGDARRLDLRRADRRRARCTSRPPRRPRPAASTSRAPSVGALLFGYLTDRFGRKKLFMVTLGVYLVFTVATALAWSFWSFMLFRVLAGSGIGGEYSAINSAIDELVPARVRGRVALAINSSWWIGTAAAAGLTVVLLNTLAVEHRLALGFGLGAILAIGILFIRHLVPESPRWLLTHGRADEAEQVVQQIEAEVQKTHPEPAGAGGRAARDRAARVDRLHLDREARDEGVPGAAACSGSR